MPLRLKVPIVRNQYQPLDLRLRDQHPVERIRVMGWKKLHGIGVLESDWEFHKSTVLAPSENGRGSLTRPRAVADSRASLVRHQMTTCVSSRTLSLNRCP